MTGVESEEKFVSKMQALEDAHYLSVYVIVQDDTAECFECIQLHRVKDEMQLDLILS